MKTIKKIIIGSSAFFDNYEDYSSKDKDVIAIMDRFLPGKNSMNMKLKGDDVFLYRNLSKDKFIQDAINSNVPMRAGKFLVPEFAEYIGLEIEDLHKLERLFEQIDDAHKYEKIIYDAYIKNGAFALTDEQRLAAYDEYKNARK